MQFFFQKVLFASFPTRYGKLLCCECFVRVFCKEYHVIERECVGLVKLTQLIVWIIFIVR